jgi:hypothetical protein
MDIKQEFREEKNMDVYAMNVNDGSFSNVYVKWLEAKINYTRCSLKLEEKHKTDFDVWAISKGYTKMEGEYVKEPEVYNYEFLLQLYNEQN